MADQISTSPNPVSVDPPAGNQPVTDQVDALVACLSCDLVYDLAQLEDGQTARCRRCNQFLSTYKADAFDRVVAYSSSALIALALACSFPFMQFSRSGLENTMTLPQTAISLWTNGMWELSLLVAGFIILIPAVLLAILLALALRLQHQRPAFWLPQLGSLVFHLQSWCMVEVFLVGVLVSLVKIAKLATVVLGISFWAYGAFAILFTLAITNLDRLQTWRRIEALSR